MIELTRIWITSADNVRSFRAAADCDGSRWIGYSAQTPLEAVLNLVGRIAASRLTAGKCQVCGRRKVHYHCRSCSKYICGECRAGQIGQSTRQAVCFHCANRRPKETASKPPAAT